MNMRKTLPVAILLNCAALQTSAGELKAGLWHVRYSDNGIQAIQYQGVTVLAKSSFTVFQPDYRGAQFSMYHAKASERPEPDGAVVEWVKDQAGAAEVTMALRLGKGRLEWSTRMRVHVAGPVEIGVLLPPAAIMLPAGIAQCRTAQSEAEIGQDETPTQTLAGPIEFLTPERDLRFEPDASSGRWIFQDRRTSMKHFRIIACLRADGKQPLEAEVKLRLRVREYPQPQVAARAKLLSQRMRTLLPMPVNNASFEDEPALTGWSHAVNASAVQEAQQPGQRCAKLVVASVDERNVYLTQHVPVRPGGRYRARAKVRTHDVRPAPVVGMATTGAVLIVEWADKQGKWLAPGQYAKGRFGTSTWHTQEVREVVAPEKAGSAIIFLGLRGLGEAWFDEVEFFEVRRAAVLLSPFDGTTLADNRPLLNWRLDPSCERYRVQLSTDPQFGPATLEAVAEAPRFVPERKLAPGRWYWRVSLDNDPPGTAWSFVQTADANADTTGPVVSVKPQSLSSPREPLIVTATDESAVDPTGLKLRVDGALRDAAAEARGPTFRVTPATPWPVGASKVTVSLADRHGNVGEASNWVVHGPRAPRAYTWTRDRGVFDGERHEFPLGIYQVQESDLARVKAAGFDFVHIYTWEGSQDDEAARRYLDAVHKAGLRAFVGFDRGNSSRNGIVQGNVGHVARRIAALRDHPGLLAWYLFDEPDLSHQYIPPKKIREYYEFIKALDPDHPVIVTLATRDGVKRYGKCYDVYWSMVYRTTPELAARLAQHRRALPGADTPLMAICHCYDRVQTSQIKFGAGVDESKFSPNERLMRANAFMSLVHGTSGMCWWWFGDHKRKWLATPDVPEMWQAHQRVLSDLRSLSPLLLAPGRDAKVSVECTPKDGNVQARLKLMDSSALLIAVNASGEEVTARIASPDLRDGVHMQVRGEGRQVRVAGGSVEDRFGPLAVHVYLSE